MKCKTLILVLMASLFAILSCDNDDYEPLYAGMGTVDRMDRRYLIRFDSGEKLALADSSLLVYCGAQRPGQRVITTFQFLENDRRQQTIYLVDLYRVLTKEFFPEPTQAESDSLGNDPVEVDDVWTGGGYLNIQFRTPTTPYAGRVHYANVIRHDTPDEKGYVRLEFRHNQNGDGRESLATSYISLPLGSLADAPGFTLTYLGLDGNQHTWTLQKKDNDTARSLNTAGAVRLE